MCTNIFILLSTLCHELIGDGLQQLWLIFLGADKVSLTGRSRLTFCSTQVPFCLASSFLLSFSLTRCRKLSLLFECFTCSMRTLILLARILPLTCLLTMMPTACCPC